MRLLVLVLQLLFSPDGTHHAEARGRAVYVDGRSAWRGRGVTSELVWSPGGDAVAFTGRDASGKSALVVVLVGGPALTWPIPRSAEPARAVTWLGPTRLGAGPSELAPRVIASFDVAAVR